MDKKNDIRISNLKYLTISPEDKPWGITVTTVGKQVIAPYETYPPVTHPLAYSFNPDKGRILSEYQIVYIVKGSGTFSSDTCSQENFGSGTLLMLYPGEWHTYKPKSDIGWTEYWVGFQGTYIDNAIDNGFFSKNHPLFKMGFNANITTLYDQIIDYAKREQSGYQQIISGIILNLLGLIFYTEKNNQFSDQYLVNKINEARTIMREEIENCPKVTELAKRIGMSYSWFRKTFKAYTGSSPAQYQINLRLTYAKELLSSTNLSISEIAFHLGFDSNSQFSSFFKKGNKMSPRDFRKQLLK